MLIPFVFLIVLPVIAAFLGVHQAWLTHARRGYSAETASSLMLLPWAPLLLGVSVYVAISTSNLEPVLEDAIAVGVGLAALGASVAAGLTGEIGLGELIGEDRPFVASGLNLTLILTGSAIVAALVMVGLADLAVFTVTSLGAAAGVGAAAAGGASYWGGQAFRIPRREIVAIATAAAIFTLLLVRALGL